MRNGGRAVPLVKQCYICKLVKESDQFYVFAGKRYRLSSRCKACDRKYLRERNATVYREGKLRSSKAYKDRTRAEMLAAYGGACECCGETTPEFLQLDHINGDGAAHRRAYSGHISTFVKELGYPREGYRLLCANCNHSRGLRGYCPHEGEAGKSA